MAYTKYSLTPANNTATPPDGAPEGMLPSAVNDTMRDMMAQIRDCGDGIRDGTYTMTAAKITGGTITGITDLAIADGGTGASTAASARTNLGLDGFVNMKNRIINGAMVIDQRNAGASVTINASAVTYTLDRWFAYGQATDGVFTVQQAGTGLGGFPQSLKVTVTTADASIGASQSYFIGQYIEGFNTADLAWGTSSAKTVTLSFWVYSSVTGTLSGSLRNSAVNRSYPFTYTVNSANTWEQKTITIAGDTTGTWVGATNGVGLGVVFSLGGGSTVSGTAGSWSASNFTNATGAVNPISTLNATIYFTGVQLEVGSTATSFDYRPYGTELGLCQRYYNRWSGGNSPYIGLAQAVGTGSNAPVARRFSWANPVDFRTTPTLSSGGTIQIYTAGLSNLAFTGFNGNQSSKNIISFDANSTSSSTIHQSVMLILDSNLAADYIDASAEL